MRAALSRLGGRVDAEAMRAMNHAVDVEKRDAAAVVRDFLASVEHRSASRGGTPAAP